MKYVDEINFVVLVLAVIAFAIATGLAHTLTQALKKIEHMEKAHAEEIKQLQAENTAIDELYKSVSSAGELQRIQDQAAMNALYGALADCQEQCKALERQTVEVEVIPAKPTTKRNSKGQFEKKETSE